MATNLQKLRAKKAANQKKESTLSASFTIDAGQDDVSDENNLSQTISDVETYDAVNSHPNTMEYTEDISITEDAIIDSNPTVPIEPNKPIIPIIETDPSVPEKNLGLRLASDEDKRYLDLAPLGRSMTKKSFFISLIENEFASVKNIDINDKTVEKFRNTSLKTTAITISVPISMIKQIKEYSAKHMMKYQRYIAYVVNKARLSDQEWQKTMA